MQPRLVRDLVDQCGRFHIVPVSLFWKAHKLVALFRADAIPTRRFWVHRVGCSLLTTAIPRDSNALETLQAIFHTRGYHPRVTPWADRGPIAKSSDDFHMESNAG